MRTGVKRGLLAMLGRPIRCELCGAELFRGLPLVRRGRLKLMGAEGALVRVDFDSMNRLAFSHVEASHCPPQQRYAP